MKASVVPLLSAPDNDILNAEDITHQSPAGVVVEILRERMFGGVTDASDSRLLALTGHLAGFTREQATFRSLPREELGEKIREMLLMALGLSMEADARDLSLRESVDRRIEEARRDENLSATVDARGNLAAAREHTASLQTKLYVAYEALKRADGKVADAEEYAKSVEAELFNTRRLLEESNERLSSAAEGLRERDEAISQKEEIQRQLEQLKVKLDSTLALKDEALARVVVLRQELSGQADSIKGLTSAAEEFKLQNQQLCQQVKDLETRCSALSEWAKLADDKVRLEVEKHLKEYKESPELKKETQQACEAYLQNYKDSSELRTEIAEACERRLTDYKASDEMKEAIWYKGLCMFVSGFNRGLREARRNPTVPLTVL
ncbi:tropomyosin alpha-3 chain-like [Manihot esculenta]|uniref:tropomyosin alpha-3 chain-like n=1 Tax=Manihot esculenta TaxID=3983 RepID=UPI001CC75B33|nr:tropomyosin alpha-3 chain-like [Manihot esculenta]